MERRAIYIHTESMADEELAFLETKDEKETKQLYKIVQVLMVVCFVLPFIAAWGKALSGGDNPFSPLYYFIGVFALLLLTSVAIYIAYRRTLHKIKKDINTRSKTIERAHIVRKQYIPRTGEYFFFIDSPTKISIEVSQEDYHNMEQGDELNIEYSTNAKLYFGYF